MRRTIGVILAAALAGCAAVPGGGDGAVSVAVHGLAGSEPETELVRQIGEQTFEGFGGVVSAQVNGPVDVYVVERVTCGSRIGFRADPGSRHVIRLSADDVEVRELMADEPMDAGPLLGPAPPLDCPPR